MELQSNVIGGAWEILQSILTWFFPPSLLAQPIVMLLLDGVYLIVGLWFLATLVFKPCYMFLKWFFKSMGN